MIKNKEQVWLYVLIMVIGYLLGYISIWFGISKKINFKKPNIRIIKKHLLPCAIMLIPVLALSIYRSMDKVMLGAMTNMTETGIYENGEKLIYCLSSLISSLGTVMMPKISYLVEIKNEKKINDYILKSLKFMMIMTSAMTFGLMSISNGIVPIIFGRKFLDSTSVLFFCSPILIFMGWSNVFRTQYIIPHKLDSIYVKSITYGSIINLISNIICIPKYGAIGAVIGTLIAELFVPAYQYLKLRNKIQYSLYIKQVIAYPIIGLLMLILLKSVEKLLGTSLYVLIVQMILGAIIYLALTYLYIKFKDEQLYKYIMNILKLKKVKK